MKNHFQDNYALLCRKGIFPYEWFDSFEKFCEPCLPPKESFYSSLTGKGATPEEYQYALDIWNHFKCETFSDYHDIYLKTDVLLLSDIFEVFRKTSIDSFKLDPSHFVTLPSFGWQCMLKVTGIKLELLTEVDKY